MVYSPKKMIERTQVLQHIARRMGMTFKEEDDYGMEALLRDFTLFNKGRHRSITNLMQLQDTWMEVEVSIFDYAYRRGRSRRNVSRQTVFFVKSKHLGLPQFLMEPETFFHKIGNLLGMQDIDFEQYPKFSNQYLLQGDDEELIRHMMDERLLKYFTVQKNWSLEGVNYYLIFYRANRLLSPRDVRRFFNQGMALHEMLKAEKMGLP